MTKIQMRPILVIVGIFTTVAVVIACALIPAKLAEEQRSKTAETTQVQSQVQALSTQTEQQALAGNQVAYQKEAQTTPAEVVLQENKPVKLLFLGDTMVGRSIGDEIVAGADPLVNMRAEFANYDFVVANLETNISTPGVGTKAAGKLYTFNAPLSAIAYLKGAGITVANLANNHTMDYGEAGLLDQIKLLNEDGFKIFGAGKDTKDAFKPLILEKDGVRIAIIGINDIETWLTKVQDDKAGSAYLSETLIQNAITSAKQEADFVIVEVHWGYEYQLDYCAVQEEWGHKFIDMGADLVVGMHPHVQQDSVGYKGKTIFYSLGNFLFDGMADYETSRGYVVAVEISLQNNDKQIDNSGQVEVEHILTTSVKYIQLDGNGWPSIVK